MEKLSGDQFASATTGRVEHRRGSPESPETARKTVGVHWNAEPRRRRNQHGAPSVDGAAGAPTFRDRRRKRQRSLGSSEARRARARVETAFRRPQVQRFAVRSSSKTGLCSSRGERPPETG